MAVKIKNNRRGSKGKITAGQAMVEAANANGVPLWILVAVKLLETGSDTGIGAVSSTGANGPFQLEPATQRSLGVKNPNNFAEAANGAAKLLAAEHRKFGSWNAALEAYNGGPGAVGKGYAYNETDAKNKLNEFGFKELIGEAHGHQPAPTAQAHTVFAANFGLPEGPAAEEILKGLGGALGLGGSGPAEEAGKALGEGPIGGAIGSVIPEPIIQAGAATTALISMITDIHFWIRLGEAIGALILIYMGLHSLTGQGPTPDSVVQTAAATKGL